MGETRDYLEQNCCIDCQTLITSDLDNEESAAYGQYHEPGEPEPGANGEACTCCNNFLVCNDCGHHDHDEHFCSFCVDNGAVEDLKDRMIE